MASHYEYNIPAPGVSYFTPLQDPPAGTAVVPQPDGKPIPKLFQPLTIRGVTFQNRVFVSPMCQYSAKNGIVTPWHLAHLGGIFTRGPGLTFTEATAVVSEGRISPEDVGIWSDDHIKPLASIVEFAHSQNQKIGIQIAHAGRKASTLPPWKSGPALAVKEADGWPDDVWGPSTIPYARSYPAPKELTKEGIKRVVKAFADAARRAISAEFDVIEIHNAHGYLLHSFISPVSNKRTDEYGGSFENRTRLTLEVVDAVRAAIPANTPLFLRISATDWLEESAPDEPSWRKEDTVRLAHLLAAHGVDLLDTSTGGNDPRQRIKPGPGYQVPFASAVKKSVVGSSLFVGAVGALHDATLARDVLENGEADVVFVGRQFQKNPGLVWEMADKLGVEIHLAKQIGWGFKGRGVKALGNDGKPKSQL